VATPTPEGKAQGRSGPASRRQRIQTGWGNLNNHDGAEVKLTHLADDGSFLAVDLDPGASCGDTCDGPQGRGIREIAKELGCSRNTVRRYLREEQASGYGPRSPRATKPDPHRACLAERVEQARPRWIPATALLRAIPELGRDGVVSQLKAWPAPLKQGTRDPVVRFETPPGQQMRANLTWVRKCLQTTTACRWCRRRAKFEPTCRPNIEPGLIAFRERSACG
jgi:hypothetical protein